MADGHDNLIPVSSRTSEELREMTRKGGIKSGEVRRRKKMMKEIAFHQVYDMPLSDALKQSLKEQGISEENLNHANVLVRSMIAKAEQGDTAAFNALLLLLGEKPKEQIGAELDMRMKIEYVDSDMGVSHSEDEVRDEG